MNTELKLDTFIDRTSVFHEVAIGHVNAVAPAEGQRHVVSFLAGMLSIEHASGALMLIKQGLYAPGFSLFRPQYECLVRGIWLLHAASEGWVSKFGEPLTLENAKKANEGLMLSEMLKQLDGSDAPSLLVDQLKQYRDVAWKALNSFAHGGIHPIARTVIGYAPQLTMDALRNSNALVALAVQLASILSGNQNSMQPIRRLHDEFSDCLPIFSARLPSVAR